MLAVCQKFELASGNGIIPRIASGFADGLGNTGAVCGAVIGAVMAISLKQKPAKTMEKALENLAVSRKFRRRFEIEMGTISCRELTGADITTQEGIDRYMSSDIPQTVCFPAVSVAYRLVVDLLKENA